MNAALGKGPPKYKFEINNNPAHRKLNEKICQPQYDKMWEAVSAGYYVLLYKQSQEKESRKVGRGPAQRCVISCNVTPSINVEKLINEAIKLVTFNKSNKLVTDMTK